MDWKTKSKKGIREEQACISLMGVMLSQHGILVHSFIFSGGLMGLH